MKTIHLIALVLAILVVVEEVNSVGLLGAGLLGLGAFKGYLIGRNGGYGRRGYGYGYPSYYNVYNSGYGGYGYPSYNYGYGYPSYHYRKRRDVMVEAAENGPQDQVIMEIARLDASTKCVLKLICEVRSNYDSKLMKLKHDIEMMLKDLSGKAHVGMVAKSFKEADAIGKYHPKDCVQTYDTCPYSLKEMVDIFHGDVEMKTTAEPTTVA